LIRHFAVCLLWLPIALLPALAQQDVITTAIGGGPNDIPANESNLNQPNALTVDSAGNYYVSTLGQNRVFKIDTTGTLTVVAGNGLAGYTGDGVAGGAVNAALNAPIGLAVDSTGVYIADYNNCVIRKVDTTNTITTIAGTGTCGFSGDNGPALSAKLYEPRGLALDNSGNLFIADYANCRVRKLALAAGTITTVAGSGTCTFGGDGGLATGAGIAYPMGVSVDNAGDLFFSDLNSYRIREVSASTQDIGTVAGTGTAGTGCPSGTATSTPIGQTYHGVSVNGAGTVVTISDFTHNCIRQFTVGGNLATIAGTGAASFCGDGGQATVACFSGPRGVALSSGGLVYVADNGNNRVRAFPVGGNISTVVGNGNITFPTLVSGMPPSGVVLNNPGDVIVDPAGNVFISEYTNCTVRELVKATGLVNIFAGSAAAGAATGTCGFSGEGGAAASAQLGNVEDIASDSAGNIYIADYSNCVVWEVAKSTGNISLFAGVTPRSCGFSGDGGQAISAKLNGPTGVFVDNKNNVYISDYNNNRVREVTGGVINTIAGNGTAGYLGDGEPATIAELRNPFGLAADSNGNLFIADYSNCVIREVTAGIISTVAGTGVCGANGDGVATQQDLNHPARIHVDPNDNLFLSDNNNELVRWVSPAGILTTIAGNGHVGLSGDTGPALNAEFDVPNGIAQDSAGNYLIADYTNLRVRGVTAFSALNILPGSLDFGLVTVGLKSTPQVLTLSALGPLAFSNISINGPFTESDDCGVALPNAATCTMDVVFKPTAAGTQDGVISIEDNGFFNNTASISLTGLGSAISIKGAPVSFGSQAVKTSSAAKKVTVTNKGTAAVTMGVITLNETTDFSISSNKCPAAGSTLAGKASCIIELVFRPKTTGAKKGALEINDSDPTSPQFVGLTGTGTSQVQLSPSSLTFGAQAVGTTSVRSKITLTNNTTASLTLSATPLTFTGPFSTVSSTTCTANLVITPTGTCLIYVVFTPTATGYPTGTLSVSDTDSTSPQTVSLLGTGTGVAFTPPTVSLSSTVGHQVSTTVTITNVGTSTIVFTNLTKTGPNSADFVTNLVDPPCNGSLAAGAICTFTLYFTPSIVGSESASLLFYDNSPGSPQSLSLSGTGQ
jgi:sugar lactone lactonase YvrE